MAEQKERATTATTHRPDIERVIKVAKSNGRVQVKLKNGKLTWLDKEEVEGFMARVEPKVVAQPVQPPTVDREEPGTVKEKSPLSMPHLPTFPIHIKTGVLTESEARQLSEVLPDALDEIFELTDKFIRVTLRGHPVVVIWSDIDEADTAILSTMFIGMGKANKEVALFVRASVTFYRQARIAEILAPRFWKTWQAYNMYGFELPGNAAWRRKMRQAQQ